MEKTTWGSAILLLSLCVLTAFVVPKDGGKQKVKTLTEEAAKMKTPTAPTTPAAPQNAQPANGQPANNPLAPTK
jgi:hypothetical protein